MRKEPYGHAPSGRIQDAEPKSPDCSPTSETGHKPKMEPAFLLDTLRYRMRLRSDAALAEALGVPAQLLSKIRNCHALVAPRILIRMHEISGLSIAELRRLMGDNRKRATYRIPAKDRVLNGRVFPIELPAAK